MGTQFAFLLTLFLVLVSIITGRQADIVLSVLLLVLLLAPSPCLCCPDIDNNKSGLQMKINSALITFESDRGCVLFVLD